MSLPRIRSEKPKNSLLFVTAAVLVIAFLGVIGLFFVFSSYAPDLVGKCVAVVSINNEIATRGTPQGLFSSGTPGSEEIAVKISSLNSREDVGAVLIVLDSPGGSAVATREIYTSVASLEKPKVAYFREVAASGAYYVGSATDYIVTDPDALTGSIGVIATFSDLSGLFQKIGYNVTPVKSAIHKDIGAPYRSMTDEERQILQSVVDEIYEEFKGAVLKNRGKKLNMNLFANSTDGRILSGRQALKAGLVDSLGSKRDAVIKAAELGNISFSKPSEIKVCNIQMTQESSSIFGLESLISKLITHEDRLSLQLR